MYYCLGEVCEKFWISNMSDLLLFYSEPQVLDYLAPFRYVHLPGVRLLGLIGC